MTSTDPDIVAPSAGELPGDGSTATHVRGSTILLAGRFISLALDFVAQVLIVRYLAKSDYGALAYALSLVSIGSSLAAFGLDKTLSRFLPIYDERKQSGSVLGAIVLAVTTMVAIGLGVVVAVHAFKDPIAGSFVTDDRAVPLLLILILLTPVQALDSLLVALFAVFSSPRSIFIRRHVLAPMLQLAVVIAVIAAGAGATMLAAGYVAAGVVGLVIYGPLLVRVLVQRGIVRRRQLRAIRFPARELFAYSAPLMSSDLVFVLRGSLVVVLVEFLRGTVEVATFRAVLPLARLNLVVIQSFTFLFVPIAARLWSRGDDQEVARLHQRSTVWVTLASFPVFALSFALADPAVAFLYGARYQDSTAVLAILALGFFASAALGFNGLTLRAQGRVRFLFIVDTLTAIASVVATVLLVQRFGALGAAISTAATLVVQSFWYAVGIEGIRAAAVRGPYLRTYLAVTLAALALLAIQSALHPPLAVGLVLAGGVSILLLWIHRDLLDVASMFPELLRLPLVARFVRGRAAP